jgi:hypothetical protein
MDMKGRRLEIEARGDAFAQVERHLMRGARCHAADRAGPADLDRPMMVTAEDALDLAVPRDDGRHRRTVDAVDGVHVADAGREGRVMHEDDRRLLRRLFEPRGEPGELLTADLALGLAGDLRVERDEADGMILDRVAEPLACRPVAGIGEHLAHARAAVVVAGDEVDRHGQRGEFLAQDAVFLAEAAIDEIAGGEDDVGRRLQGGERGDGAAQHGVGLDDAVAAPTARPDMEVGDLRDDHARRLPCGLAAA